MINFRGFTSVTFLIIATVLVGLAIIALLSYSFVTETPILEILAPLIPGTHETPNEPSTPLTQNNSLTNSLGASSSSSSSGPGGGGGGSSSSGSSSSGGPGPDLNNTNVTQCNDNLDNDGDGWIDVLDLGCASNEDDNETYVGSTQCGNERDDDSDNLTDGYDPGCTSPGDDDETDSSQISLCSDGIDNDGDGWIDFDGNGNLNRKDPGCSSLGDNNEDNMPTGHECSDGIDNDGDIVKDGNDNDCSRWDDDSEGQDIITGGNATYLVPGNGWNNQLIQTPLANGIGPTPIGRWDFVPYQTINNGEEIGIGVVAFHIYGIDRVLFSVENGSWTEVREMTYNPYSRVWEYWVKMKTSDFGNDGLKELRAIIYPKIGQPRVLQGNDLTSDANGIHSMFLNTNKYGSLQTYVRYVDIVNGNDITGNGLQGNPFKSLYVAAHDLTVDYGSSDGGVIYAMPGNYFWGNQTLPNNYIKTSMRWLTIRAAPGYSRTSVQINESKIEGVNGPRGFSTKLTHIYEITINHTDFRTSGVEKPFLWVDNTFLTGRNLNENFRGFIDPDWRTGGTYITDSEFTLSRVMVSSPTFARNIYAHDGIEDAFRNAQFVINATVENLLDPINFTGDPPHTDVLQYFEFPENVIIYNLKAIKEIHGQTLFVNEDDPNMSTYVKDWAFVNYLVYNAGGGNSGKFNMPSEHLLFWNMVHFSKLQINPSSDSIYPNVIKYFSVRNSVFERFFINNGVNMAENDMSEFNNNHFIAGNQFYGFNYTIGGSISILFANPSINDFHPSANSILRGANRAYVQRLVPADFEGTAIPEDGTGAIGSLQ